MRHDPLNTSWEHDLLHHSAPTSKKVRLNNWNQIQCNSIYIHVLIFMNVFAVSLFHLYEDCLSDYSMLQHVFLKIRWDRPMCFMESCVNYLSCLLVGILEMFNWIIPGILQTDFVSDMKHKTKQMLSRLNIRNRMNIVPSQVLNIFIFSSLFSYNFCKV